MIMPFVKIYRAVNKAAQKHSREFSQEQQRQQYHAQRQRSQQHKKKIDPTVGEYVQFTEVTTKETHTQADGSTSSVSESESQVTDVTWEDL